MAAGWARGTAWNGGERRALEYAIAASLVLHALVLGCLPLPRAPAAPAPPPPLEARLISPRPVEAARPAAPPARIEPKPAPPEIDRPAPRPKPRVAARRALNKPAANSEPAPQPAPQPAPVAAPRAQAEPAVIVAPAAAPAPAPVRIDAASLAARYRAALIAEAGRYKRYPRFARDNGWEGKAELRMAIGPDGAIASLRVARGSGYSILDRQALEMVRSAQPRIAIPEGLRGRAFSLDIPVIFSLRDPDA